MYNVRKSLSFLRTWSSDANSPDARDARAALYCIFFFFEIGFWLFSLPVAFFAATFDEVWFLVKSISGFSTLPAAIHKIRIKLLQSNAPKTSENENYRLYKFIG